MFISSQKHVDVRSRKDPAVPSRVFDCSPSKSSLGANASCVDDCASRESKDSVIQILVRWFLLLKICFHTNVLTFLCPKESVLMRDKAFLFVSGARNS